MKQMLERLEGVVNKVLNLCGVILFLGIFTVVLLQVFMRYVLGAPLVWSEELARYLFIWISYLGWVFATRSGTHIRISAFFNVLPLPLRKGVAAVNQMLVVIFALVLGWLGYRMVLMNLDVPAVTLFFTYAFVYLSVPVMNFFIALQAILNLLKGAEEKGGTLS